jgi:hypothetical protein
MPPAPEIDQVDDGLRSLGHGCRTEGAFLSPGVEHLLHSREESSSIDTPTGAGQSELLDEIVPIAFRGLLIVKKVHNPACLLAGRRLRGAPIAEYTRDRCEFPLASGTW